MYVDECLKNIRCDIAGCHTQAKYNIDTRSYKGQICLCENCFNKLLSNMQKAKKTVSQNKIKN